MASMTPRRTRSTRAAAEELRTAAEVEEEEEEDNDEEEEEGEGEELEEEEEEEEDALTEMEVGSVEGLDGKGILSGRKATPVVKKTRPAKAKNLQAEIDNRGVVYLSYIPPKLSAMKLRHLLSKYGEVLRVFLAPEARELRQARKEKGKKHKGKKYVEG